MEELDIKKYHRLLSERNFSAIRKGFKEYNPTDIAEVVDGEDISDQIMYFRLIERSKRAEAFTYLDIDDQKNLLEELNDSVVISVMNQMDPVDRTKLLEDLTPEISNSIILKLDPEERQLAWKLLSYPEDSVGRIMSPEFVALKKNMLVNQAIEYVRWNASRYSEELLNQIFVVSSSGEYLGEISLVGLLLADPTSQPVGEVMETGFSLLNATDDQETAVDVFRKYDRTLMPVVDESNVLVGVVHSEDVFAVAEEEASEDIQQFGGVEALDVSYFNTGLASLIKKRAGWLAVLFIGGIVTGKAIKYYDAAFDTMAFLVVFLPLIISSGGNSGSQAASLIIRGIAIRDMELSDWYRVLVRESITGLGLGLFLGFLGFVCSIFWGFNYSVGIIVAISLLGIVIFGAIAGSMLPFALQRLKLDPAVCSSPLVASLVDVVGVVIFANVALLIAQYFKVF